MAGPLLRSGKLSEFRPLGTVGHPVFTSAQQLRVAIRRQIGAEEADMLAIPQINEAGDHVDWYSPVPGPVVPWSAATEDERAAAKAAIESLRARLEQYNRAQVAQAASTAARPGDSAEVFNRLLPLTGRAPDDSHVYLVGGKPVVTFWGFDPVQAPPGWDGLGTLAVRRAETAAAAAAPVAAAAAVTAIAAPAAGLAWWRWLLWALLGLLLLGLLLFGLRSCGVPLPVGLDALPLPGLHDTPAPDRGAPPVVVPGTVGPGTVVPGAVGPDGVTVQVPGQGTAGRDEKAPSDAGDVGKPPSEGGDAQTPPGEKTPGDKTHGGKAPDEKTPATPPQPPLPDKSAEAKTPPLVIPPDALKSGNTDFLNGHWRSRTGLVESETGQPVEAEYDFKDGKGTATLHRADGTACSAPAQAAIRGGQLVIDQTAAAKCPDGTSFRRSQVECKPGADGRASCHGTQAGGADYHVDIVK